MPCRAAAAMTGASDCQVTRFAGKDIEDRSAAAAQPDEALAFGVAAGRGQYRHVHHPAQESAVAPGCAFARGVCRELSASVPARPRGEPVVRADQSGLAVGSDEYCFQPESNARKAGDHFCPRMSAKSDLDRSVGGVDALVGNSSARAPARPPARR